MRVEQWLPVRRNRPEQLVLHQLRQTQPVQEVPRIQPLVLPLLLQPEEQTPGQQVQDRHRQRRQLQRLSRSC